jgi:protein gp37
MPALAPAGGIEAQSKVEAEKYLGLARASASNAKWKLALGYAQKALDKDPTNDEAKRITATAREAMSNERPSE